MKAKNKRKIKEVDLPESARRVLSFMIDRENEYNLFCSYELLERHCGEDAGEGLDYLLKRKLVNFDESYCMYFATADGERVAA